MSGSYERGRLYGRMPRGRLHGRAAAGGAYLPACSRQSSTAVKMALEVTEAPE